MEMKRGHCGAGPCASLDSLLAGVEAAVSEARRQAAAAQAQAHHWQQQFEQERHLRQQQERQHHQQEHGSLQQEEEEELQQQQQQQQQAEHQQQGGHQHGMQEPPGVTGAAAAAAATATATAAPACPGSPRTRPLSPEDRSVSVRTAVAQTKAVGAVARRHTAPPLRSAATALGSPQLLDQLTSTASQLEALRQELERDVQEGKGAGTDGSVALSRLSSLLQACSFLREASAAACTSRRNSGDLGEDMSRQDSAATYREQGQQEVALHDDGAAGVAATAAAAVSVALAQSWAAAAGARQASFRHAAAAEGAVRPGKARFKLVAAVPRSYRSRLEQQQGRDRLASSASRSSLAPSASRASLATVQGDGGSPALSAMPPKSALLQSGSSLDNLAEAEPGALDESQEATWRASGQHLKLQWLSPPTTVLVVFKPVPAVKPSCVRAIAWLLQHRLTVWVEPETWGELVPAVAECLEGNDGSEPTSGGIGSSGGSILTAGGGITSRLANSSGPALEIGSPFNSLDSPSYSNRNGNDGRDGFSKPGVVAAGTSGASAAAIATSEAPARTHSGLPPRPPPPPPPAVDLSQQLRTWEGPPCGCPPAVPCSVAHQIDLVITLGGDGTVLWTCGLFRAGAVPPLVPLAMGSLGFMTPFEIEGHLEKVLSRVVSLDRGLPLMLRHRLQCRIIRGGTPAASSPDLASAASQACLEEFVVLNEVVIDRGMTAQLCNLQCFVDNAHVTVVQGDGLIVATPTGSTAYNLAAGGSMVHPAVPCFLFTPICPHSLSSRPLVLPEHVTLRVKVPLDSRSSAYCSFDGRSRQELRPGDSVLIGMSQWPAPMVCNLDASHDWFLSMREGLHWNMRIQQKGRGQ